MTFYSLSLSLGDTVFHQLCSLIYLCLLFQHKWPSRLLFHLVQEGGSDWPSLSLPAGARPRHWVSAWDPPSLSPLSWSWEEGAMGPL